MTHNPNMPVDHQDEMENSLEDGEILETDDLSDEVGEIIPEK